jgi:hypothetical protein
VRRTPDGRCTRDGSFRFASDDTVDDLLAEVDHLDDAVAELFFDGISREGPWLRFRRLTLASEG